MCIAPTSPYDHYKLAYPPEYDDEEPEEDDDSREEDLDEE